MKRDTVSDDRIPLTTFVVNIDAQHELTIRELKCIRYLLCDYSVKEIAAYLFISPDGVYKILERLCNRYNLNSFEGLCGWVLHHNVIVVNPDFEQNSKRKDSWL